MSSNLGVLLLNKLLLSYWGFKQPVLLTFLHMASSVVFIWGLWGVKLLTIQRLQSLKQLVKVVVLSLVFALAVLCANVSLKFLEVSMNQAIGAATPVFAAIFAFIVQGAISHTNTPLNLCIVPALVFSTHPRQFRHLPTGERESMTTYSTLLLVVGGVVVASGVEPNLNIFGALICFLGAALRGLRAVMQVLTCRLNCLSTTAASLPLSLALCGCGIRVTMHKRVQNRT